MKVLYIIVTLTPASWCHPYVHSNKVYTVRLMCLGKQLPANTSLEICMSFLCGTLVENGKRSTIGVYPCNQHVNKQATEIRREERGGRNDIQPSLDTYHRMSQLVNCSKGELPWIAARSGRKWSYTAVFMKNEYQCNYDIISWWQRPLLFWGVGLR